MRVLGEVVELPGLNRPERRVLRDRIVPAEHGGTGVGDRAEQGRDGADARENGGVCLVERETPRQAGRTEWTERR
jgi:hypothetical protein